MKITASLFLVMFFLTIAMGFHGDSTSGAAENGLGFLYLEKTGVKTKNFFWSIVRQGENFLIVAQEKDICYSNLCRSDGETVMWQVEGPDTFLKAELVGDAIVLKGHRQRAEIDKLLPLKGGSWRQPLAFSLKEFLVSGQEELHFTFIRLDRLELVNMLATKKVQALSSACDLKQPAQMVEVRPAGLLGRMWQCKYWFRQDDGVFLRYEGVHGLPGTPKTVISLIDEKADVANLKLLHSEQ